MRAAVGGVVADIADSQDRQQRRRIRTRQALVRAAQQLLAEGRTEVSVLDITTLADVGNGSFYNHFASKADLFETAVMAVLDDHGALMDSLTAGMDDPADAFTQSFRMTGRLHRRFPQMSKVVLNRVHAVLAATDSGLVPRARRDLVAAAEAGRFIIADIDIAVAAVAGAALSLGVLVHEQPARDDALAADEMAAHLLRGFGVPETEVSKLVSRPLPDLVLSAL